VVPPSAVIDNYEVPVDTDTADALGITDPDDAFILAIVSVAGEGGTHTVNLLGPVIVNRVSGKARQLVLVDGNYPLQHPLG
jgi:flagellar assembly factor FliW